jgi:endonuclease III
MTAPNRAVRIEQLSKALKKFYKQVPVATDRSVLELLLYACCLEDAKSEAADEAFAKLQQTYYDWNEVRVTTVVELAEVLSSLPDPIAAASRVKKNLQSMFESRYSFDIDDMKKMNLGKAVTDLEGWGGASKFVVAFVTQHALGGHAIPIDSATLEILKLFEVITPAEYDKKQVPGIERTIPKARGPEFASLLHQFAADFHANPKSPLALSVFKDLGVSPKPKPAPPPPKPAPEPPKKSAKKAEKPVAAPAKTVASGKTKAPQRKIAPAKKAVEQKKPKPPKQAETKKNAKASPPAKQKSVKKIEKSTSHKSAPNKMSKKKPR